MRQEADARAPQLTARAGACAASLSVAVLRRAARVPGGDEHARCQRRAARAARRCSREGFADHGLRRNRAVDARAPGSRCRDRRRSGRAVWPWSASAADAPACARTRTGPGSPPGPVPLRSPAKRSVRRGARRPEAGLRPDVLQLVGRRTRSWRSGCGRGPRTARCRRRRWSSRTAPGCRRGTAREPAGLPSIFSHTVGPRIDQGHRRDQAQQAADQGALGGQALPEHRHQQDREVAAGGDGEGQADHEGHVLLLEHVAEIDGEDAEARRWRSWRPGSRRSSLARPLANTEA